METLAQETVLSQPALSGMALTAVNMCDIGCTIERRVVQLPGGRSSSAPVTVVSGWDCLAKLSELVKSGSEPEPDLEPELEPNPVALEPRRAATAFAYCASPR